MRPEADAAGGELSVQPFDRLFQLGALDAQFEIAKAQAQQLIVGECFPGVPRPGAAGT